jgi:hypothetical protein
LSKAGEYVGEGLATGGVAGAASYAIKNANLSPTAKAGLVVASGLGTSIVKKLLPKLTTSNDASPTSSHPNSPSDGPTGSFSPSSPLENSSGFDLLYSLFGVDPNNVFSSIIFDILCLNFIILYFVYSLALFLGFGYIYNNYDLN